jgi:hypothetical protein
MDREAVAATVAVMCSYKEIGNKGDVENIPRS